jgi:hypothetical protein
MIGTLVTVWINGVLKFTYDFTTGNDGGTPGTPDSVIYRHGNPGVGFFLNQAGAVAADYLTYGWSALTISDSIQS